MRNFHHKQRGLAMLLAIVMTLALFPAVNTAAAQVGDVIFSEGFETAGTLGQNGEATITSTTDFASSGSYGLSVSPSSENNWSGVSIRNDSLSTQMLPGGTYKLTAKALSEKDATLGVRVETKDGSGGNTYGSVGSTKANLKANQWSNIEMQFAVPADHQSVSSIVFHNDDKIVDLTFYLDDVQIIIVTMPKPAVEPEADAKIAELLTFGFDNKEAQGSLFAPAGGASSIEWFNALGVGKNDDSVLKINHIDEKSYTSADNAIRLTLSEPLPARGIYNISAWVYVPVEGNEGKGELTGPGYVLNQDYAGSAYKLPGNASSTRLTPGEWFEVNVNTPVMNETLWCIDIRLVTNDGANHADIWYIDNIVISQVGELAEIEIPEWDLSLASLADTYKDYFLIGNIMEPHEVLKNETTTMFKHHYNAVTAENAMKPQYLSPSKGKYNFTNADNLVEWSRTNSIPVHGHALVWHSQSAAWLTNDEEGNALTREQAKANLEEYINNVAGHYKGKLMSWDVVNEIFDGGRDIPTDWKDPSVQRVESPWYIAYENGADKSKGENGADYVYDAFAFTRLADLDSVLYYNDYNETDAWKREAMALMAEELNAKWKTDARNTQPDRLLIEGLGMQSHYWTDNLKVSDVEASIVRFAKAGVRISVSELDIPQGLYSDQHDSSDLTPEQEAYQAQLYAQLFEIYKKYADNIERVTIWGKADPQSWRGNGLPVTFDKMFKAKEAYRAAINPKSYLLANWKNPYQDVSAGDWFFSTVAYADTFNLIDGAGEATFAPQSQATLGQFITALYRWSGQPSTNDAAFNWAVSNGFISAGSGADQPLNRQDMAVIIEKYISYSGRNLQSNTQHTYADEDAIAVDAKAAVQLLYNANIVTGKTGNLFDPAGMVSRAEMSSILYRLTNVVQTVNK